MNIPDGYKLVPVEPTKEMLEAAYNAPLPLVFLDSMRAHYDLKTKTGYKAMLGAAPVPPQPIYDEAKERELFEEFSRRIVAHDSANFPIRWCDCVPDEAIEDHLNTWLACAQSRAKSVEVGHE